MIRGAQTIQTLSVSELSEEKQISEIKAALEKIKNEDKKNKKE